MQVLKKLEQIAFMKKKGDSLFFKKLNGGLLQYSSNEDIINIITENFQNFEIFRGKIIYKIKESNKIYLLNKNGVKDIIFDKDIQKERLGLGENQIIEDRLPIYSCPPNGYIKESMYLLDTELNLEKHQPFEYWAKFKNLYFPLDKEKIVAYSFFPKTILWETSIVNFGKRKEFNHDTQNWDLLPNQIWGKGGNALYFFDNKIIASLDGQQLVALDIQTGTKIWMEEREKGGWYSVYENKIYESNGSLLTVFDASSGGLLRSIKFKEIEGIEDFQAAGSIWAYDDIIVIIHGYYGKILVLDRITLKKRGYIELECPIPFGNSVLHWHENKLFVYGQGFILYILTL